VHLSFELEKSKMDARAYRMKLHFSLHCHLLPHHHLFLHYHFLLNHGLAFCCESAGVGTLRAGSIGWIASGVLTSASGHSDVQPGMSRRGREKNNSIQEKLGHRRLHLTMATASPIQV